MNTKIMCSATALAVGFAVAGFSGAALAATSDPSFTIDENTISSDALTNGGVGNSAVTGDQFSGTYNAVINQTVGGTNSWVETGAITLDEVLKFNGSGQSINHASLLGQNNGYTMYVDYTLTGTGSISGGVDSGNFTGFTWSLYIAPSGGAVTTGTNDQISIAGAHLAAQGSIFDGAGSSTGTLVLNGANSGSWNLFGAVTTTNPAFASIFVSPSPFYIDFYGLGTNFQPSCASGANGPSCPITSTTTTLAPGQYKLDENGSVNISFIPEPASLTLFGAALLGLGALTRRRKKI